MTFHINQRVTTPIGEGVIQGRFAGGWLVRLPVNDTTKSRTSITPHAALLWVFTETEIK